jgi:hypothetical protein
MAIQIKSTSKFVARPKFLLYSDPGGAKTSLAATVATQGENDVLFAFTEGGIQTVSHLNLPYVDITTPQSFEELYKMLKAGKPEPEQHGIWLGQRLYRGIVVDLHSHLVQMNLIDMVKDAKASNADRDIDDPSQYEYKKLNFRMIRQINELTKLNLKYMGFTAYAEKRIDRQTGSLLEMKPALCGFGHLAVGCRPHGLRLSPECSSLRQGCG